MLDVPDYFADISYSSATSNDVSDKPQGGSALEHLQDYISPAAT